MCGRFTQTAPIALLAELGVIGADDLAPRFNIAPTQRVSIVLGDRGKRAAATRRWGMKPAWAKALMINARIETAATKPSFRDALRHRRCLIPADGFFEWRTELTGGKRKLPVYFAVAGRHAVALAGLWDGDACAILTGPAVGVVADVHDRMPLVVPASAYDPWLDPELPVDAAEALLGGAPWQATAVSTYVNHVAHDDPRCIAPDAPTPPIQGSLF
jgi:putative SOS response-associated peptidase YedK